MQPNAEITNEYIRKALTQGKQYCISLLKSGPNRNQPRAEAEQLQMEHLRYLFQLRAEGKLLINGPVTDDPDLRGIAIYNTSDKEEVKRLLDGDPAVRAGRDMHEIHSWFGFPGDALR
jgi:uncharacterized protein YciI